MLLSKKQGATSALIHGETQDSVCLSVDSIFRMHAGFVMRAVRRMGVLDADVEDVSQDVFVAVKRRIGTFDFTAGGSLKDTAGGSFNVL